jgi:hypothetical protein
MSVSPESLQLAWQRQALDAPRINLAYLRHRTEILRRRSRIRNAFEYLGGAVAVVWVLSSGWSFIRPRPLMSASIALWVLAMVYIMFQWHRRAGAQTPAAQLGTLDALQFYRQQLERQRDARRGNWRWWLPPLAPGLVVMFAAFIVEVKPTPWVAVIGLAAWVVFGVVMGAMSYERVACGLQREIDALDSMTPKS